MRVQLEPIDSLVLGRNVLTVKDFHIHEDFAEFERAYRHEHDPLYVACKIPASDLRAIHQLEAAGFQYIEFQISAAGRVKKHDLSMQPYRSVEVTTSEDLAAVLEIASTSFEHDRFAVDPSLGRPFSGDRYRRYVEKSFHSPDEYLHKLCLPDGEIAAFITFRMLGPEEGALVLGAVKNEYKSFGLGLLNDFYAINELQRMGAKRFSGAWSGINYPILNTEIRGLGVRITSTAVVLRKLYPPLAGE